MYRVFPLPWTVFVQGILIIVRQFCAQGWAQVKFQSSRMGTFSLFSQRLYPWIVRLQTLGVIATGIDILIITCAMCGGPVGHNTCVTGDSVDRILATAIGRADS